MAYPKLGLLLHPGRAHTGQIHVVDIGIPPEAAEAADVRTEVLDNPWAAVRLPRRAPDAHKGECGRVLAVAGSAGMMGAGRLVCAAAYRSGAGLVRHAAPASLLAIAHGGRDEVMVTPLEDQASGHFLPLMGDDLASLQEALGWADVVALGPGLGLHEETAAFLTQAMESPDEAKPLVLDADGLNLLADNPDLRRVWSGPVVITPHPGEAARLAGQSIEGIQEDRPARAAELARTFDAVTVLKGAPTLIAEPGGRLALCPLGNPGLATGGAGDVLTGMIAGLLAQGMAPFEGASLAVYLHALAGDLAAMDLGIWSLLAGDLIGYLPAAFGHIEAFPDRDVLADGVFG